ncbi:SH3 domain-containing protein [uncultured Proteiniphilum sp.]|uniref:SH3 domain-containing protein n=1 Tax=uncultured Proteiniphilum sp. TaxID=497637 RepID=UPI00260A430B|nr:SH3 domain-containing protein [uncultured Proteiniphilum sp.]
MALTEKYKELMDLARLNNLSVSESGNVLRVEGIVPSAAVKDKMWEIYERTDPHFKSNDLVLNVKTKVTDGDKVRVVTKESRLNIRQGPGTDQPIIGKAEKGDTITLISKTNDQWWLVRDNDGEEGYCYSQYLEPIQ